MQRGFVDSIAVWRSYVFLKNSPVVQQVMYNCLLLNGILFGGSLMLYHLIIRPSVSWALESDVATGALDLVFEWLWCWPIYTFSLIFNALWYQDMVSHLYSVLHTDVRSLIELHPEQVSTLDATELQYIVDAIRNKPPPGQPHASRLAPVFVTQQLFGGLNRLKQAGADEVLRVVLVLTCTVGIGIGSLLAKWMLPASEWIGDALSWVGLAAVHSFHAYDYRWSVLPLRSKDDTGNNMGGVPTLMEKVAFLDRHLTYFVSFGSVMALVLMSLPRFAAASVYALVFPIMVLQSLSAKPSGRYLFSFFRALFQSTLGLVRIVRLVRVCKLKQR